MTKAIVISGPIKTLPFRDAFTWEEFQTFCADYLHIKYDKPISDTREYLASGSKQEGIDIYVAVYDKLIVAQCKLEKNIGPKKIESIVNEFLKASFASKVNYFILCTSADLARANTELAIQKAREKLADLNISLTIWDANGFSLELRNNSSTECLNLVARSFSTEVAKAFYGDIFSAHIAKLSVVQKQQYKLQVDYIVREVYKFGEQMPKHDFFQPVWHTYKPRPTLAHILRTGEADKIVLLAVAGYGKSEEITNLAASFALPEESLHPVKLMLKNYSQQSVVTLLETYNPAWQNIKFQNLLLLFDGLDEMDENTAQAFIRELNLFVELQPAVKVVVSSRFNFYNTKYPPLTGFKIYILSALELSAMTDYMVQKLGNEIDHFRAVASNNKFDQYLSNPYYLTRLVRFYKTDKDYFPLNSSELFEKILFEQLDADKNRYHLNIRSVLLPVAHKLAMIMTLAGKTSLSDAEVKLIEQNEDVRENLSRLRIFNKHTDQSGNWSFEHKNLQEYLAAKLIAGIDFGQLIKLITFEFNPKVLQPRYLNTVAFLFEIAPAHLFQQLVTWLRENAPETFIRFEKEKLSSATRLQIFKSVLAYYKMENLPLRVTTYFDVKELAEFLDIDSEGIEYIQNEIESNLTATHASDLLYLLSYTRKPYRFKQQIIAICFTVLRSNYYDARIKGTAIYVLEVLEFHSRDIFDNILATGIDVSDYDIRKALVDFAFSGGYAEDVEDFIFQTVHLFYSKQNKISATYADILKDNLLRFNRPLSVLKLVKLVSGKRSFLDVHDEYNGFQFQASEIGQLLEKAQIVFSTHPAIVPAVYRLYRKMEHVPLESGWFPHFKTFFQNTCGLYPVSVSLLKSGNTDLDAVAFADWKFCEMLLQHYKQGKLQALRLSQLRNQLSYLNPKLGAKLQEALVQLDHDTFNLDSFGEEYYPPVNQPLLNQQMLLDKQFLFEKVKEIFEHLELEELGKNELYISSNRSLYRFQSSLAFMMLRKFASNSPGITVRYNQFVDYYNLPGKWEWAVVRAAWNLVQSNIKVDPALIDLLKEWCRERITNLDFMLTCNQPAGKFTTTEEVELVKNIYISLSPTLPEEIGLKLLIADAQTSFGFERDKITVSSVIIRSIQDIELLKKTVLNNIRSQQLSVAVLCTHFVICAKMKYTDCLTDIFSAITQIAAIDEFYRIELTRHYISLGGSFEDFKPFIKSPSDSDNIHTASWNWFIIEELLQRFPAQMNNLLKPLVGHDYDSPTQLRAAKCLIILGQLEGFLWMQGFTFEKNELPVEGKWPALLAGLLKMPAENVIDVSISLFNHTCYAIPFRSNEAESIREVAFKNLLAVANLGHENFQRVIAGLDQLVNQYAHLQIIQSIKFYKESLVQKYYNSKTQLVTVQDAINIFRQLELNNLLNTIHNH